MLETSTNGAGAETKQRHSEHSSKDLPTPHNPAIAQQPQHKDSECDVEQTKNGAPPCWIKSHSRRFGP